MGNSSSSQPLVPNSEFLSNYMITFEADNIKHLLHKITEETYILKELSFANKHQYEREFNNIMRLNEDQEYMDCQNVLKMVKLWKKEHHGICSNVFKIYVVFEFPKVTLFEEINARRAENKHFEEAQLFSILQSCINAMRIFSTPLTISPSNIFIVADGMLKVISYELLGNEYRSVYKSNFYYAPQKIEDFSNSDREDASSLQIQGIFSIGMTLLHSALLRTLQPCYEIDQKRLNLKKLEFYLSELPNSYSKILHQTIYMMVEPNPNDRCTLDDLQNIVNTYFSSQNQSMSSIFKNNQEIAELPTSVRQSIELMNSHKNSIQLINSNHYEQSKHQNTIINVHELSGNQTETFIPQPTAYNNLIQSASSYKWSLPTNGNQQVTEQCPANLPLHQNLFDEENLPKNHSILKKSKNQQKSSQIAEKQNLYTDPKILQMIRTEVQKIKHHKQPLSSKQVNTFSIVNLNSDQKHSQNHHTRNNLDLSIKADSSPKQSVAELMSGATTTKDYFNEYEFVSTNKRNKCIFVMEAYEDSSKFQGMVLDKCKNGYGKLTYADGAYYEGNFKNDKINGKGILYYEKGRPAYSGEWVTDSFHGQGTLYNEYLVQLETTFDYTDFNKVLDCWLKYEGNFDMDQKNGAGKLTLTNGEYISGHFINGSLEGEAVFTNILGEKIKGIWKQNSLISRIVMQ